MKHRARFVCVLTAATLLGCALPVLAPTPAPASAPVTEALRVQPLQSVTSPVSAVDGLVTMGRSAQSAGQLALAEQRYAFALDLQPAHLDALNAMAILYAQSERIDLAIEAFQRALKLAPQAAHLHSNLGFAFFLAGRLEESEVELQLARDRSPANGLTGQNREPPERPAEHSLSGPQLVAIGRNVYELRDRPGAVSAPLEGVQMEVSNGVGIRHLARRTAQRLMSTGLVPARLTNQLPFQQSKTEIEFGSGQAPAADALSAQFPMSVKTVASRRLLKNIQLRLVLGHDAAGKALLAWLESVADTRVAIALQDGWRWS